MTTTLENKIKYLDEQYRIGNALISDKAFDQLERNLLRTSPNCDYFAHKNNLLLPSIESSDYKKFLSSLLKNTRLSIEPKIDGCAIAISYKNGTFKKAINRNGLDVSNKIFQIADVPSSIPIKRDLQVRGELYITNKSSSFSQKNISKYLRGEETFKENYSFCCFQILNGRLNQYETLNYLKKCGFSTPNSYFTNFTSQVEIFRKKWLNKEIFMNYPTDGIVIKVNSRKLQCIREKSYAEYRNWQYAIKE